MPVLQSSGQITMADIESAFDGTATLGNQLGGYYGKTRGLPTSGQITFSDFYGKNGGALVTTGYALVFGQDLWGYLITGTGSISDPGFYNGTNTATIEQMYYNDTANTLTVTTSGVVANLSSTFVTLEVNGNNFARTAATYSTGAGGEGVWTWATATNYMGTSGSRDIKLKAA